MAFFFISVYWSSDKLNEFGAQEGGGVSDIAAQHVLSSCCKLGPAEPSEGRKNKDETSHSVILACSAAPQQSL